MSSLKKFKKASRKIKKSETMCYITSEEIFNKMTIKKKCKKSICTMILKKDVSHLYNITPSITNISVNISDKRKLTEIQRSEIRKKYNISNRFWVPRVFNHAFNILITNICSYLISFF